MVSVVVPALIRSEDQLSTTIECLRAAKTKTKLPFELVIVETGTNFLKEYACVYIHEKNKTNSTISINRGFKCASGDVVVLLTNDVIVDGGWLENLLECFKISDCGLATLATNQFMHKKSKYINEGIWFSVAAIPKEQAWFDEEYAGAWDDSDLIMRVYQTGKKMYRNYASVVDHKVGMTLYKDPAHDEKFQRGKALFMKNWADKKDQWIYNVLVTGYVV